MTEFDGTYYDGRTSARHEVRVRALGGSLHIVGEAVNLEVPLAIASIDSPIPGMRRVIRLPGEAELLLDDRPGLDALFPHAHRLESLVHTLERRWRPAVAGLFVVVAFSAWCVIYGLPLAARFAAGFVSPELEAKLGEQALASIDAALCGPSKLDDHHQRSLQATFGNLTAGLDDGHHYRLEMRSCPKVGPNAFALPGGAIVFTDELDELAQNDAQLAAAMAHEIGHVRYRHGLRQVLQAAGLATLITTLTGDATSIASLAVILPTALLQSGYSRDFEDEADGYAFQRLRELGVSPRAFAEIIARLEEFRSKGAHADKKPSSARTLDYLSTHPATARRIERALASP